MTDNLYTVKPGLRVYVDQSEHPIHDDVQSMGARLLLDNGDIAEVQIARVGDELIVIANGDYRFSRTPEGYARVSVLPTPKEAK
jgi:hypothetical protein